MAGYILLLALSVTGPPQGPPLGLGLTCTTAPSPMGIRSMRASIEQCLSRELAHTVSRCRSSPSRGPCPRIDSSLRAALGSAPPRMRPDTGALRRRGLLRQPCVMPCAPRPLPRAMRARRAGRRRAHHAGARRPHLRSPVRATVAVAVYAPCRACLACRPSPCTPCGSPPAPSADRPYALAVAMRAQRGPACPMRVAVRASVAVAERAMLAGCVSAVAVPVPRDTPLPPERVWQQAPGGYPPTPWPLPHVTAM